MKEELEEGHFDSAGHFQWKKDKDIKDNWLDNLDWVKIKKLDGARKEQSSSATESRGLADSSSDDEDESLDNFDVIGAYRRILELMKPNETIKKTLQRLGKESAKISSIERFRRKKAGIVDENSVLVTEITELCNKILTKLGNMDVYEESYDEINKKFASKVKATDDLDIYGDDFEVKEQQIIGECSGTSANVSTSTATAQPPTDNNIVKWVFKWTMNDTEIHGPYETDQMQKWVDDGYFKGGVFVKKHGTDSDFHSSNRIDFDLYL